MASQASPDRIGAVKLSPTPIETATPTTKLEQLCYSSSTINAYIANNHRWNDKEYHSENSYFVIIHQVDSEITAMRVFEMAKKVNLEVLKIMAKQHPEAFAVPPEMDIEEDVKEEQHESIQDLLCDRSRSAKTSIRQQI